MKFLEKTEKHNNAVSEIIKERGFDLIKPNGKNVSIEDLDGIVVFDKEEVIGLGLYYIQNEECDVIFLETFNQNQIIEKEIMERIRKISIENNCKRIWYASKK